jgi:hypothetical protein
MGSDRERRRAKRGAYGPCAQFDSADTTIAAALFAQDLAQQIAASSYCLSEISPSS